LSTAETAQRLATSVEVGLSQNEADARLHTYGPNELPREQPEPLWLRFLKQFKETLILLLLGSAAVSFLLGNLEDAISITAAVTIVVTVGFVQEYRSEKSLEALNRLVRLIMRISLEMEGLAAKMTLSMSVTLKRRLRYRRQDRFLRR